MQLQTLHIAASNCSRKEHSPRGCRECKKILSPLGKEDRVPEDEVIHDFSDGEAVEEFPEVEETKFEPLPELDLEEDEKDLSYKHNRKEKVSDLPKRITRSETKKAKASSKVLFCVRK
jgi:hypothetical protein